MDRENDDVITDFDQTNGQAPGLEGESGGGRDTDGDGILEGDEVDMNDPFGAIDGDDDEGDGGVLPIIPPVKTN